MGIRLEKDSTATVGGSGSTIEAGQIRREIQTLSATTGAVDMDNNDLTNGSYITVTATGNITLSQTTALDTAFSGTWFLEFTQDGSGGHTLAFSGSNILTPGGVAPSVSTGAGDVDLLVFNSDSSGRSILVEHRKAYA